MKKLIFIFVITTTLAYSGAYAQQKVFTWNLGISGGVAGKQTFNSAFGADAGIQARFNKVFSATFDVGFEHMFESNSVDHEKYPFPYGSSYNSYPLQAGLKANIVNGFYVATEAGIAISSKDITYQNSFIWTPSVGFSLQNGLDFSLRYEDRTRIKESQNFGLRIGYSLPFKSK